LHRRGESVRPRRLKRRPIADTYEADTHCPPCAVARFRQEPGHPWVPEDATDSEANAVDVIAREISGATRPTRTMGF
jgi:hypothetical protein